MDIEKWLSDLELGQYTEIFIANDIDDRVLAGLTDSDLKEMGIASLGHRKKILAAINSGTAAARLPDPQPYNAGTNRDVFISYSTNDDAIAREVMSSFENVGIKCFFAPRELKEKGGVSYAESLIEALYSVRALVLVFSASANTSEYVKREVDRAVARGIHIIPLRVENMNPTKAMEFYLATPQWINAYDPPLEEHIRLLTKTIQSFLAQNPASEESPAYIERMKKAYKKAGKENWQYAAFWLGSRFASGLKFYLDLQKIPGSQNGQGYQFLFKEFLKYTAIAGISASMEQIYKAITTSASEQQQNSVKQSSLEEIYKKLSGARGSEAGSWFVAGVSVSSLYSQNMHAGLTVPYGQALEECKKCFDSLLEIGRLENLEQAFLDNIKRMRTGLDLQADDFSNLRNLIDELVITIETYLLTGESAFDPEIAQPIIEQNALFAMYALKWFITNNPGSGRALELLTLAGATEVFSEDVKLDTLFPEDKIELLAWSLEETIKREAGTTRAHKAEQLLERITQFRTPVDQRKKIAPTEEASGRQPLAPTKIGAVMWQPSFSDKALHEWQKLTFTDVDWSAGNGICMGKGLGFLLSQNKFRTDFRLDVHMRIAEKMHELADGGIVINCDPDKKTFSGSFFSLRIDQQTIGEIIQKEQGSKMIFAMPFPVFLQAWNKLSLVAKGEQMQFFINDKLFHSGNNPLLQQGSIGLRVVHAVVEFKDLTVYALESGTESGTLSNEPVKEEKMGLLQKLFSGKQNDNSTADKAQDAPQKTAILETIKKSTIDAMIQAGGAPPSVPGVPDDHMAVLVMHSYHPKMQRGDQAGGQAALKMAIASYKVGLLTIECRNDEYRIIENR